MECPECIEKEGIIRKNRGFIAFLSTNRPTLYSAYVREYNRYIVLRRRARNNNIVPPKKDPGDRLKAWLDNKVAKR